MELTIEEFIEKTKVIDELKVKKESEIGIYRWETIGDNLELKEYISQQLIENLNIKDCYLLPGHQSRWIKKEYIDGIIDNIINSKTYDEMINKLNNWQYLHAEKEYDNDIINSIRISCSSEFRSKIINLIKIKLESKIKIIHEEYSAISIKNKECDIKEECKHQCKTNYKKEKFNEIFNL